MNYFKRLVNIQIISIFFLVVTLNADWDLNKYYHKSKDYISGSDKKVISKEELRQERFDRVWNDIFEELKEGSTLVQERESLPASKFMSRDQEDVDAETIDLIDNIISIILNDDILKYKNAIKSYNENIKDLESDKLTFREKRVQAPTAGSVITASKSDYDEKIKDASLAIVEYKKKIEQTKINLINDFEDVGVALTEEEIEVLLDRVDGDNIIQMALVMDVLSQINVQILNLMQESDEELSLAKKYYAMHLVTWKLIVYIQQKYIDRVNTKYIPKIESIEQKSLTVIKNTKKHIRGEKDSRRKGVYKSNLEAQKLSLKVAKMYKSNLKDSVKNMEKAQKMSKANLDLAKNTYATVSLSADLYKIVSDSQKLFERVNQIQMPKIVPFKNSKIKEEYTKLTKKLKTAS